MFPLILFLLPLLLLLCRSLQFGKLFSKQFSLSQGANKYSPEQVKQAAFPRPGHKLCCCCCFMILRSICSQRPVSENADDVGWPRSGFRVSLDVLGWRREPRRPWDNERIWETELCFACGSFMKIETLAQVLWTRTHVLIYTPSYGGCHT